jgi:hypothetical protein
VVDLSRAMSIGLSPWRFMKKRKAPLSNRACKLTIMGLQM